MTKVPVNGPGGVPNGRFRVTDTPTISPAATCSGEPSDDPTAVPTQS